MISIAVSDSLNTSPRTTECYYLISIPDVIMAYFSGAPRQVAGPARAFRVKRAVLGLAQKVSILNLVCFYRVSCSLKLSFIDCLNVRPSRAAQALPFLRAQSSTQPIWQLQSVC